MLSDSLILVHFCPKCNKNFTISEIFRISDNPKPFFIVSLGKTAYNDHYKSEMMGEKDVETMTMEMVSALFRACDCAMLCTKGGRVVFANPAAVTALGEDPTGQSAAAVLPERLLKLQGKLGAASAKIRDRDAVVTVSRAGLYRAYSLRFLLPSARALPLPEPQWTALANLRLAAEQCMADGGENAAQILKSYYQLHRWFLNVATLSALRDGTLPFRRTETDCAAFLRQTAKSLSPLAERRDTELVTELPEDEMTIALDETLLERMLMNLLLNALQSCAKGGRVRLGLAIREDAAVITVQDTGCGIPPEKLSGVFSAYDCHPGVGAGCGLPVVMGIARMHGGDVLLDSTPGFGTAVIVTLPRVKLGGLTLRSEAPDYDGADRARFLSGFADLLEAEDLI